MSSKPTRRKDVLDSIINLKKRQREINGLNRQNFSGLGSSAFGSVSGTASSGSSGSVDSGGNDNDYRIKSSGDTMVGPLAFNFKSSTISNGVIDVGEDDAYSSRVIVIGQGGAADNLEVILNASFRGQILFFQPLQAVTLQSHQKTATAWASGTSYSIGDVVLYSNQRYTCYVAHTSSASITPTDATKWHRNNIRITGATEQVVAIDEIILLQYDSTDGVWTVVSGGGSGSSGAGLSDDNVWTGINTFQGAATSINSATINLGDSATDVINMIAKCNSLATNTWAGTNTFNSGVFFNSAVTFTGTPINFNSNQINLGDNNATDNVFVLATMKMYGDFNANTYDMYNIDRLKFGTTAGSGSALAASDTGIEAVYSGGNSYGMKTVVPANNIYQMFIGSSEKVTITTSSIVLNNPVTIGGSVAIGDNYMEYGDMTSANVGTTPANKRRVFSDSANNDELSVKKSDGSVVSLEASGSGASLSANNNFTGINSFTNSSGSFTVSTPTVSLGTGAGNINIFGNITMSNNKITGLGTPTATTDAATKAYVDANAGSSGAPLNGNNTWTGNNTFSADVRVKDSKKVKAYTGEIGFYVGTGGSNAIGTQGTIQVPRNNGFSGTASAADTDFGSETGCIGIMESGGVPWLAIRNSSGHWYINGSTPVRVY